MSYDLRIGARIVGTDIITAIAEPDYSSPTYNLRDMFVACMDWNYELGKWYPCTEVIEKVEHGIRELKTKRKDYIKYNPSNGWGDVDSAVRVLESLRMCIYDKAEEIPIEHLWMTWG